MAAVNRQWYCDDTFWKDFHEYIFDESKEINAALEVESIIRILGLDGGAVLDMPCGPGRHSVVFAQNGFSVTGVDINQRLLELAASRAAESGVEVEFVLSDMREFCREESYDLAINMFTSLGYYNDFSQDLKVVEGIYRSLKYGGAAVFEMSGREILKNSFRPLVVVEGADGARLEKRLESTVAWEKIRNHWTIYKDGKTSSCCFEQTIYSEGELRRLLESAGFADVTFYGSWDCDSYGPNAQRLIAVAKK